MASTPSSSSARRRTLGIAVASFGLLAVLLAGIWMATRRHRTAEPATIAYSELLTALSSRQVDSIAVRPGREVIGWWSAGAAAKTGTAFRVVYTARDVDGLMAAAAASGAAIAFRELPADRSAYIGFLGTILVIGLLGLVIWRQTSASFAQADAGEEGSSALTFAAVAGNTAAITDLQEVVTFLKDPARYTAMGARVPKGVLMEGPPGTGKTLMARALAGEAGVPFFTVSGSEITGMFVGLGAARIKALFRKARRHGGVIFIDEIDALGGKRGRSSSHNEDDRTLNQLLVEMDGFAPSDGVVVIGATNRAGELDPALLRKGRFDRSVTVGLPTLSERAEILRLHIRDRKVPLAEDVDLERLARLMPGTSGAELAGLVNEAAITAVRAGASTVAWHHVEEARDRVLLGRAREGFVVSDEERRLVAVHEAGHAIAGVLCCPRDPLHKVTVQPRGSAMGVAFFQPDAETHLQSREYLEGQILKGLAGRAAEELVFGARRITTGAASDLQHTTRVAKQMVYRMGMGETTGLLVYDPESGPVSAETHQRMDQDVRALLDALYEQVKELLATHRTALEALADALVEQETLSGADALALLAEHGCFRPRVVAA